MSGNTCISRRAAGQRLGLLGLATITAAANAHTAIAQPDAEPTPPPAPTGDSLYLASNEYPWSVFYARDGRNFREDLATSLTEVKESGLTGFEPSVHAADDAVMLARACERAGLGMRSVYTGSSLISESTTRDDVTRIVAMAKAARDAIGMELVVTNPTPLGRPRTDAELLELSRGQHAWRVAGGGRCTARLPPPLAGDGMRRT